MSIKVENTKVIQISEQNVWVFALLLWVIEVLSILLCLSDQKCHIKAKHKANDETVLKSKLGSEGISLLLLVRVM